MKKLKKLGTLFLIIGLISCSSKTMTWADCEKDINKCIENGWSFYHENEEDALLKCEKELETLFKKELNKDYDVTLVSGRWLSKELGEIIVFHEFKNSNEPEYVYELYSSREGNMVKVYISGTILIETNCQAGIDLLGYTFK